jgi:arsenical pump membrane protein
MTAAISIYTIAAISLLGVVVRPWRSPEAAWAVVGAAALVLFGLLSLRSALSAMAKGIDVYLFLLGMMLLSAIAEREGLFDYLAAVCVTRARGSPARLFTLVYVIGTIVTIFMSNDATAVVLTPAVLAVSKKAKAKPLPYLFACALIANAASFVLPISNPANLVVFGDKLPPLATWAARFLLPSVLSITATFAALRWLSRADLAGRISDEVTVPDLPATARLAAAGIALVALVLLLASALDVSLGLPTLLAAAAAWISVAIRKRESPWPLLGHLSWSIVPLVAGLFVIVEGLQHAGLLAWLNGLLGRAETASPTGAALGSGAIVAFVCNLMNNLPAGLIAGSVATSSHLSDLVQSAVAIGIDLGPNLSVAGSLATILWLVALRKQGQHVGGWTFLKTGVVVMPLALVAALGGLWLQSTLVG